MPTIEVSRGSDGELMINDGVTRATRIAKLLPGILVRVEVIDDYPAPVGHLPTIGDGVEMVLPGDNAAVIVNLDKPVALDIGSHFAIREGGKTVGSGVITEVVE